jgi:isoquinoline 1-oxidoreductase subunit beta
MSVPRLSRRAFLRSGAAAGGVLVVGAMIPGCGREPAPRSSAPFAPNAWVRITQDGLVTVVVDRSEMGQGVATALPMLVAEELDADWSKVRFEFAPANPAYANPLFGAAQLTGGSSSVRAAWTPLREAGARARAMLVQAAAARWNVAAETCRTEDGFVVHDPSGRRADYGSLVEAAARLAIPATVKLKDPKAFRLIGKPTARLDAERQVEGRPIFGIDVQLPGMLTACIARCPTLGGKLARFEGAKASALPGVKHVLALDNGVAVVAEGYWSARQGVEALDVTWEHGPNANLSSVALADDFEQALDTEGKVARGEGDPMAVKSGTRIEARYRVPYLAHATMEPMNCTAHVTAGHCEVWAPTQYQQGDPNFGGGVRRVAADTAGLKEPQVDVHTTQLGGGFGRRLELDYVADAVALSRQLGVPVKVVWSREDDMQHDYYRPASHHALEAVIDDGAPVAWRHRIASQSILARWIPGLLPEWLVTLLTPVKHGVDPNAVEGAVEMPYAIANVRVEWMPMDVPVPVGFWRSVGHSYTGFVVESFIDELARAANADPYRFRRDLLKSAPRHRAVLDLAAAKAGWAEPPAPGRHRGIAVHESFGSVVAQVAEVSVEGGEIRVHRVVCAVDCGLVVNPLTAEAQIAGGVAFGLAAALHGEITFENGRVQQSNFHDYALLRCLEAPQVEVHFVGGGDSPAGVGEPGVPPIAAAVANAVYAATGTRLRSLPLRL